MDFSEKEIQQRLLAFENQYKQLITSRDEAIGNSEIGLCRFFVITALTSNR